MTVDPLVSWLQAELARMLDLPVDRIQHDTSLTGLGLDSLMAVRLCGALSEKLGFDVDPMIIFDGDTIGQIAANCGADRPA